uniref:Uncharacterized protein n=1 Tax=Photinus pyralis TaxID=7054 RepID=A0A1Y1MGB9_PHOPY
MVLPSAQNSIRMNENPALGYAPVIPGQPLMGLQNTTIMGNWPVDHIKTSGVLVMNPTSVEGRRFAFFSLSPQAYSTFDGRQSADSTNLQLDRGPKQNIYRSPRKRHPQNRRLTTNLGRLQRPKERSSSDAPGKGDGHRNTARIPVCRHRHLGNGLAVSRVRIRRLGLTRIKGHPIKEIGSEVVVLQRQQGPVSQARHLLGNSLDPGHNQRLLARL